MLVAGLILVFAHCKVSSPLFVPSDIPGDFVIGALLPLSQNKDGQCQGINPMTLLWKETLHHAIRNLEKSNKYNISVGLTVRDTCKSRTTSLEQALGLVNSYQSTLPNRPKVIAVVSPSQERATSLLLSLFKIPQLYFSNSRIRSTEENQGYTFTSVKVGHYRSKALVDLIQFFNWKSVAVIVSNGLEMESKLYEEFVLHAGVCIAVKKKIKDGVHLQEEMSAEIVQKIRMLDGVKAVILYTTIEDTIAILKAAASSTRNSRYFTWVDALGSSLLQPREAVRTGESVIGMTAEFNFLKSLRNSVFKRSLKEEAFKIKETVSLKDQRDFHESLSYAEEMFETLSGNLCDSHGGCADQNIQVAKQQAENLQGILNSVTMVSMAMSSLIDRICVDKAKSQCLENLTPRQVSLQMAKVTKVLEMSTSQQNHHCGLKQNLFSLVKIQGNITRPKNVRVVGTWDKSWFINKKALTLEGRSEIPESSCSPVCPVGYIRDTKHAGKCCWSCSPCHYNQYVLDNYTCADCTRGYWPSPDYRKCEFKLGVTFTSCTIGLLSVATVLSLLVL
ncbi:predicted protein [Nematostella vectensis]|uniref:Uncharacterized protein n=1 Tax=Nematostella vectensis TaxID=45351 RepID=A7SC18_NEMVE|nr:predicted protein [Nematostella vectensis]|eukprot:XP_001630792.1 predicted protein [Nematostella vectensis]